MTNSVNNEQNTNNSFFQARNEFLVKKNTEKAINDLINLLNTPNLQDVYIIKNILALAYIDNKNYLEAAQVYEDLGEKFQVGFCELLSGNIDKAEEIWKNLPESSAVNWGHALIGFIKLDAKIIPSFLQIRNYFESNIGQFIKAGKLNYAENLVAYSDYLASIHPETYKFIGKALFYNNYSVLAMEYYTKSVEHIPNDPEVYYLMAQCMISQRLYREAKQSLKKSLEINKSYTPAKRLLGEVDNRTKFKLF